MPEDLKQYGCLIYDYSNYPAMAERLAREDGFGTVYYYTTKIINGYPDHRPLDVGRNIPNVKMVKEWADVIGKVSIVVFCDSHEPGLQLYFESIGKAVFGCRRACELEHDKGFLKETMKEIGLPVGQYYTCYGIDELESLLKEKDNVYVKSKLRGDMETWHHETYELSKGELTRTRNHMGVYANKEIYLVEEPIDSIGEIGIDSFSINGRFPETVLTGIELKDTGYLGCITYYNNLPYQLKNVTDKFRDTFDRLNYRGSHSNEIIISENKQGYCCDLTNRLPQPPTDLYLELYTNFPQIVWQVANGIIPVVEYKYKWGVQLIIKSDCAKADPSPLIVPVEYQQNVKIKNLVIDEKGTYWYTPQGIEMVEIGSVCGWGDTMNEAVRMAKKVAESIKGFDIKINTDCISKAKEQINNLHKAGIDYLS